MAKKSRRQLSKRAIASTPAAPVIRGSEFNPDYSMVIRDLKRIGILAGSLFGALIILSFFFH
ncbi:MAG: hypothetical protein ACP5QU_05995 [Anaerolineae bacterium]